MDHVQSIRHALLALGPQTVDIGPSDIGAFCTHCSRFQHVLTGPDAAVQMHLNLVAHRVNDGLQSANGTQCAIQLPPTVVRHHNRICPDIAGFQGITRINDAFDDQRPVPHLAKLANAVPVERLVKGLRCPGAERGGVFDAFGMAHDIPEEPSLGLQHAKTPLNLGHHVGNRRGGEFGRGGQSVLEVLVTLAQQLQINGDDGRRAFGVLGAVKEPLHEVVILKGVDLHPERLGRVFGHVFDRTDRHGGQAVGHSKRLSGFGRFDLTIEMLHAGEANRGQCYRHRHIFTNHLCLGCAAFHIDGHALA